MSEAIELARLQRELVALRDKNARLTDALGKARNQLVDMQSQIAALAATPHTFAAVLAVDHVKRELEVSQGGRRLLVGAGPTLDLENLSLGSHVELSENLVALATTAPSQAGEVATITTAVDNDRVSVSTGSGTGYIALIPPEMIDLSLKAGDTVRWDPRAHIILERLTASEVEELVVVETPDAEFSDIGGLSQQIEQIRDAVELPFLRPELFERYQLRAPKGVLLYGPPGCGKTLIAKAVAASLAQNRPGAQRAKFISVKGPELLSKYVGETERQIRAIFEQARIFASADTPVVIFFDEMEALFRIRGSGISSDVETMVVPQLLAELDGVEQLSNVIVIGASNREDMIDPAVLRPGRLDIKIRVHRPTEVGAQEIFAKYLTADLPLADSNGEALPARESARYVREMIDRAVAVLYSRGEQSKIFDATLATGTVVSLRITDLISGAMIAAIVSRAKKAAIKRELQGGPAGIDAELLLAALHAEVRETVELVAASSPEEWGRINGFAAERIVALSLRATAAFV